MPHLTSSSSQKTAPPTTSLQTPSPPLSCPLLPCYVFTNISNSSVLPQVNSFTSPTTGIHLIVAPHLEAPIKLSDTPFRQHTSRELDMRLFHNYNPVTAVFL